MITFYMLLEMNWAQIYHNRALKTQAGAFTPACVCRLKDDRADIQKAILCQKPGRLSDKGKPPWFGVLYYF